MCYITLCTQVVTSNARTSTFIYNSVVLAWAEHWLFAKVAFNGASTDVLLMLADSFSSWAWRLCGTNDRVLTKRWMCRRKLEITRNPERRKNPRQKGASHNSPLAISTKVAMARYSHVPSVSIPACTCFVEEFELACKWCKRLALNPDSWQFWKATGNVPDTVWKLSGIRECVWLSSNRVVHAITPSHTGNIPKTFRNKCGMNPNRIWLSSYVHLIARPLP